MKATKSALEARSSSTTPNDTLTKLGTATHKLVQLTDQNSHLHSALKKAREHILLQDRLLKESSLSSVEGQKSSRLFQEAFQSFEAQVKDKEAEIERLKGELGFVTNGGKKEERRGGMVGMAMWPDEDATVSAVPRSQNSWIQGQWNRL